MKNKSKFQKSAFYFAILSAVFSISSMIFLYLKIDNLGWRNPVAASLLASIFFFAFVTFILFIIGSADIPSLKVGDNSEQNQ